MSNFDPWGYGPVVIPNAPAPGEVQAGEATWWNPSGINKFIEEGSE